VSCTVLVGGAADGTLERLCSVTNHESRVFHVRLVLPGDRYGRDDCLVLGGRDGDRADDAMVEFYDATYAREPGHGPRGQFVSRYYLTTLIGVDHFHQGGELDRGIDLDGGVPVWQVSAANVRQAVAWAVRELVRRASCVGASS